MRCRRSDRVSIISRRLPHLVFIFPAGCSTGVAPVTAGHPHISRMLYGHSDAQTPSFSQIRPLSQHPGRMQRLLLTSMTYSPVKRTEQIRSSCQVSGGNIAFQLTVSIAIRFVAVYSIEVKLITYRQTCPRRITHPAIVCMFASRWRLGATYFRTNRRGGHPPLPKVGGSFDIRDISA